MRRKKAKYKISQVTIIICDFFSARCGRLAAQHSLSHSLSISDVETIVAAANRYEASRPSQLN